LVTQSEKNRRILPGKTFEYMRTGKPILALGPENGEVSRILKETGSGYMIDYTDVSTINSKLLQMFNHWKQGSNESPVTNNIITHYSRQFLAKRLSDMFKDIL